MLYSLLITGAGELAVYRTFLQLRLKKGTRREAAGKVREAAGKVREAARKVRTSAGQGAQIRGRFLSVVM